MVWFGWVGWLVGWLFGTVVTCLVEVWIRFVLFCWFGWLVAWLLGCLAGWSALQLFEQLPAADRVSPAACGKQAREHAKSTAYRPPQNLATPWHANSECARPPQAAFRAPGPLHAPPLDLTSRPRRGARKPPSRGSPPLEKQPCRALARDLSRGACKPLPRGSPSPQ